jgi:hypothetical protein
LRGASKAEGTWPKYRRRIRNTNIKNDEKKLIKALSGMVNYLALYPNLLLQRHFGEAPSLPAHCGTVRSRQSLEIRCGQ